MNGRRTNDRIVEALLRLVASALFFSTCFATVAQSQTPLSFEAANKLYDEGKFPDAASAYEKLISSGKISATLYFNLGNAYFKSSQIGRAVAAYHQAERLAPRDPDIRANLRFAHNQVQGPTAAPNPIEGWVRRLTLNEWTILTSAAVWVFFGLLIGTQVRPDLGRVFRPYVALSALAAVLFAVALVYCLYEQERVKMAIVTVADALVRQRPLDGSPNAFTVHDGAEMRILDRRDNWLQVSPDSSRIGWIPIENVIVTTAF